ncbi:MAG: transglycosylase SLT domain-containing protein [Bryobacteraceae bacterium]|nr:transglycosylase SLT domain-containing protein [Bryobacteraceae bacterium]
MSFLPPAPKSSTPAQIEAPHVAANPYFTESSAFLKPNLEIPPRPSQVDVRIRHADERLASGKRLFNQGDISAARFEFDASIDILLGTPESLPDRYKIEKRLEYLVAEIHKFDVNRLGASDMSGLPSYDKAPLEDILDMTFPVDPSLKPRVREQVQATVSQLPLEMNDSVLSYINYFSGDRGRKTILAGLKRAGRYRPLISRILAEEGVPQELIYLAQAESGFLPRALSNKAAVGMWQFVQYRGRQYGLMQTQFSDDRLDPEKATRSAARHLRDLYKKFGDWYLAIAGYNCGDGCVERAIQRTGYADFWEIRNRNAIPRETTNYVPIILAMTIMHKNAKDYGLEGFEAESPINYETFRVESSTHLGLIADAADRPVSEIRDLNPALLSTIAPAGFEVHVPAGTQAQALAGISAIPAERRAAWRIHRVAEGDTLESIARRYSMTVSSITAANNVGEAELGEVLAIPTASQIERFSRAVAKRPAQKTSRSLPRVAGRTKSSTAHTIKATAKRPPASSKPARRRIAQRGTQTAGLH